jgi:UDP-N-acetylglucosamine/UDP-N-acetylgalactosamine diphosphorylase
MGDPKDLEIVRAAFMAPEVRELPSRFVAPTSFDVSAPAVGLAGRAALEAGRVAVLMVAGGLSTRMGSDRLRGEMSIGPVTNRSIFQLHAETLAALRSRYRARIPYLIMTSAQVHDATVEYFQRHEYFGLDQKDIRFFQQLSLPVLDRVGSPISSHRGCWVTAPIGHGGMLAGFSRDHLVDWLRERSVELVFYFQYPNVLERICDPLLLGAHICGGYEATTKGLMTVIKREKVGRIISSEESELSRIKIIEYHDIERLDAYERFISMPANAGTHVWSLEFIEKCISDGITLPYRLVRHRQPGSDQELWKAEQMVFDLLPYARNTGYYEVDRSREYAVVKNAAGTDSLATARALLSNVYHSWLCSAGAVGDPQSPVEISPFFALDEAEVKQKVPRGFVYDKDSVF